MKQASPEADFPPARVRAVKDAAAKRLLPWFARNGRALPWRKEPRDPYRVWLSEVMLQQTRIAAAVPYFERFLARFPTIPALAAATEDEVLSVWEGLGYYARARNLRRAAQACVERHGGALPDTAGALAALPGFGPYTASAVAAFAFGRAEPVVDGNVMRVFSRLFAFGGDVSSPSVKQKMTELARALLLPGRAAEASEAWMELGETLCPPLSPSCASCPVRAVCAAHAAGREADYPVRAKKAPVPHREEVALVLRRADGKVLLLRRDARNGLLAGLWRFPSAPAEEGLAAAKAAAGCPGARTEKTPFFEVDHAFTHFTLHVRAFRAEVPRGAPLPVPPGPAAWAGPAERKKVGLAKTDAAVFAAAFPPPPPA
ncbi:MAG: A/G-specific adenine glycosylase, partial [Kiritimatiellae bacterium]|nr:A/G-specific adenine glycosylase [Kiritimatiellia bacterium]